MFKIGDKVRIARQLVDENEAYYDLKDDILIITQVISSKEQHNDFDKSNGQILYAFKEVNCTFYEHEIEKYVGKENNMEGGLKLDKLVTLIFEHRRDKDIQEETYTINELIYGIGKTGQPVKEIVEAYSEDGYTLINSKL